MTGRRLLHFGVRRSKVKVYRKWFLCHFSFVMKLGLLDISELVFICICRAIGQLSRSWGDNLWKSGLLALHDFSGVCRPIRLKFSLSIDNNRYCSVYILRCAGQRSRSQGHVEIAYSAISNQLYTIFYVIFQRISTVAVDCIKALPRALTLWIFRFYAECQGHSVT